MAKQDVKIRDIAEQLTASGQELVKLSYVDPPFTTVQNRAQMVDLTNDLLPRFGIDRVTIQDMVQMVEEIGPNGEPVYRPVNDKFHQVRLVGQWATAIDSHGPYIDGVEADPNTYVEITFYGTGLNMAQRASNGALDLDTYVDGVFEATTTFGPTSTILTGRNYSTNQIFPVVSGLTLGFHTVRIHGKVGNAGNWLIYGFETVNETASLIVNPGEAYKNGKRQTLAAQATTPYDSGFSLESGLDTGKGGHVVTYLEDDTFKKAVQWADQTAAYMSSVDHSNEEVISTYFWREFGDGRAGATGDFSLLQLTSRTSAHTLNDGTATMNGLNVLTRGSENLGVSNSVNDRWEITFVGTGLDFIRDEAASGGTREYDVYVDGVNIHTFTDGGIVGTKIEKIVSGLPYGTHTVKLALSTVGATNDFQVSQFLVYGPKTPSLPDDAVVLSDYFLMADFDATGFTAAVNEVLPGTIRKMNTREFVYSGTWSAITWSSRNSGANTNTSTANDYYEYTFFGTGASIRTPGTGTGAVQYEIQIDGAPNATGTSVGGTNDGAGLYSNPISTDAVVYFTGLTLGVHTVRVTRKAGAGTLHNDCIDVITPVHAPKFNGPVVKQNTLRVGSQAVRDLRSLAEKDQLSSDAIGLSSGVTETSSLLVPVDYEITTFYAPKAGLYTVFYKVGIENTSTTGLTTTTLYINGVRYNKQLNHQFEFGTANSRRVANGSANIYLEKGEHTVQLQFSTSVGTLVLVGLERYLQISEAQRV